MKNKAIIFIFLGIFCLFTTSCKKKVLTDENNKKSEVTTTQKQSYAELYHDSVYLTCEGNLLEHEVIWKNQKIYVPAYIRMKRHLKFNDNRLVWDFTNAAELKVSQNIYDYVTTLWTCFNQQLAAGTHKLEILEDNYFKVLPIESTEK